MFKPIADQGSECCKPYGLAAEASSKIGNMWTILGIYEVLLLVSMFKRFPSKQGAIFFLHGLVFRRARLHRLRAGFREGDEDSNFSVFRVRWFTESPGPLH